MDNTRRVATLGLLAVTVAALSPNRAHTTPTAPAADPALPGPATPDPLAQAEGAVEAGRDPFDHLTAPVMLNGQGPFPFVVDTGASISCASRSLAVALGIPIEEERQVHTMVGVRRAPVAVIDELTVGVRRERRMSALAIPLDEREVQGVLAVDWLKGQRVTLDFANKALTFARSQSERTAQGKVVVPARRRHGQLTIVDAELGDKRVSAMIDSGSEESLCNSALLRLLDPVQAVPRQPTMVQMVSIVGEPFAGELVYLPFLRLGGLMIGNVPVVHSDAHGFEIWGFKDTPAILLGMDLLRQFEAVSLDFGRSQVRFDFAEL